MIHMMNETDTQDHDQAQRRGQWSGVGQDGRASEGPTNLGDLAALCLGELVVAERRLEELAVRVQHLGVRHAVAQLHPVVRHGLERRGGGGGVTGESMDWTGLGGIALLC